MHLFIIPNIWIFNNKSNLLWHLLENQVYKPGKFAQRSTMSPPLSPELKISIDLCEYKWHLGKMFAYIYCYYYVRNVRNMITLIICQNKWLILLQMRLLPNKLRTMLTLFTSRETPIYKDHPELFQCNLWVNKHRQIQLVG